jgi:hypothetical protein
MRNIEKIKNKLPVLYNTLTVIELNPLKENNKKSKKIYIKKYKATINDSQIFYKSISNIL